MNDNFMDSIRVTEEYKKDAMMTIFYTVVNSADILSLEEVLKSQETVQSKLSKDEILATYALSREIKISKLTSKRNENLSEYLNEEKLSRFINAVVEDIEDTRLRTPNVEWKLSVNKILNRLKREKTSDEEVTIMESSKKTSGTCKIIDIREHSEK